MTAISVITICYNNLQELKDTLTSVDIQTSIPYEHIIVDGSLNSEIRHYLETITQPPFRKWICEKDSGISDAFNKGIAIASGDVIHLLNSGDIYFEDKALEKVIRAFNDNPVITWLHGKYLQYRGGMTSIAGKPFDKSLLYRGMRQVGHPAMFVKKELYKKYGFYDTSKKIAMDYDFLVRIRDEKFVFIPDVLIRFAPSGVSEQNINAGLAEVAESYTRQLGSSFKQKLWFLRIRLLNIVLQTRVGKYLFGLKNKNKR